MGENEGEQGGGQDWGGHCGLVSLADGLRQW